MRVTRLCCAALAGALMAGPWARTDAQTKPRLAVLDFFPVEHTDKRPGPPLADKVSETLQNTGQYVLVNRTAVRERMTERDWAITSAVDQTRRVTQLGKELDAAWIIWGRYVDMGRVWSLSLFMVNVSTGKQEGVVTEDVTGDVGDLLKVTPQATHRLLMQIGRDTREFKIPGFPDLPPVSLPPLPAGVDELDARHRQVQAVHDTLEKLRVTHTEQHPHVIFYRDKEEELAKNLLNDVKDAIKSLEDQYEQMRVYYKPAHPAMQAIENRYSRLNGMMPVLTSSGLGLPQQISIGLGGGITMTMVLVPSGTFAMGSPSYEKSRDDDEAPHPVAITRPFYMGVYEVTRGQFARFVAETGYKTEAEKEGRAFALAGKQVDKVEGVSWKEPGFKQTDADPATLVSWNDAVAFCQWLSRKADGTVRLPTEAEWEYACRAGTRTAYQWGNDAEDGRGWCNAGDLTLKAKLSLSAALTFNWEDGHVFTAPVGSFKPNAWGLYDMHGNVSEWCNDWYGDYPRGKVTDPSGPPIGTIRVVRGGSWLSVPIYCRSAFRIPYTPALRNVGNGFRCVRTVDSP